MEIGKSLHTDVLYTETGVFLVGKMESLVIVYNQFIDLVFFCLLCLLFTGSGTAATRATANGPTVKVVAAVKRERPLLNFSLGIT